VSKRKTILKKIFLEKYTYIISKNYQTMMFLVIIVAIISHWRWLDVNATFAWGDYISFIRSYDRWLEMVRLPQVWDTNLGGGFGDYNLMLFYYPFHMVVGFLVKISGQVNIVTNAAFLLLPAILLPLVMYLVLRKLSLTKTASFVGSLIYSLNTYVLLSEAGGHLYFIQAAVWAPLAFLFTKRALERQSVTDAVVAGVSCFLISSSEFRIFYMFICLFLIYTVFKILESFKKKNKTILKQTCLAGLIIIIYLSLSAYWLVPFIESGSSQNNIASSRTIFGDSYMDLPHAVSLTQPFWTAGHGMANGTVQKVLVQNYILIFVSLLGLWLCKRKIDYIFLFILLITGIFLGKQSAPPFPGLYKWLFNNFPGFYAFRESSKFYLIIAFGYATTIAYTLSVLRSKKILTAILASYLILINIHNTLPLINGSIGTMFIGKKIPEEYSSWNKNLSQQKEEFRTLWVPYFPFWTYFSDKKPQVGIYDLYAKYETTIFKNLKTAESDNGSSIIPDSQHKILSILNQQYSNELLDKLNIKYVIVPINTSYSEDDIFLNYGLNDRDYIVRYLEKLTYLKKVSDKNSELVIFENSDYGGKVIFSNSLDLISEKVSQSEYIQTNPSKYEVKVDQKSKFINLMETYNPNWKIYINKNQEISSIQNDLGMNSFDISNVPIPSKGFILFQSQFYAHVGAIISIVCGVICIAVLYFKRKTIL